MEQKASVGRVVHYVLADGPNTYRHRPALVVRTWGENEGPSETVQLAVFVDGTNDLSDGCEPGTSILRPLWRTSIPHDEATKAPGTWHWPEREG